MKKHVRSHKRACKHCLQLFNFEILPVHEPKCLLNSSQNLPSTSNNPPISENLETNSESKLKSRLKILKTDLEYTKNLPSEDIKLLTSNKKHYIIEKRQEKINKNVNLETLKPWQQSVMNLMTPENYDNRTIHVLYDQKGGIGKTTLKKHVDKFQNFLTISGPQTISLQPAYQKLLQNLDNDFWNIIIDLPRATQFLPSFIEQIKDNMFPSYNHYQPPLSISNNNILIFCNNLNLMRNLSQDRLKVYIVEDEILKEKNIRFHKGQLELCTPVSRMNPFPHRKLTFCKNVICVSDCKICEEFMCTKCNKCTKCQVCTCNLVCKHCNIIFSSTSNLKKHSSICNSNDISNKKFKYDENSFKKFITSTVPEDRILKFKKCDYCKTEIDISKMHSHLISKHLLHVNDYLYQFDMCM